MNEYLIDTHILLWYIEGNTKLSKNIIEILDNQNNTIFLSKASLWEISIKISINKLKLNLPFSSLENFLKEKDFFVIDFEFSDLNILLNLPFHHNDPFDRLIISQSINLNYCLISDDPMFSLYEMNLFK